MPDTLYSFFILPDGSYLEAAKPVPLSYYPDGTLAVDRRPDPWATWDGSAWVRGSVPVATSVELDAVAERVAAELFEQDLQMKALGLVLADLVEATFNVSQSVARQQVKTRFRDYYRGLLK